MQCCKTEFHELGTAGHRLTLPHFCYSCSKLAIIIPANFTGKNLKLLQMSLETVIWGSYYVNIADFWMKKWKMTQISFKSYIDPVLESQPSIIWIGFKLLILIFLSLGLKLLDLLQVLVESIFVIPCFSCPIIHWTNLRLCRMPMHVSWLVLSSENLLKNRSCLKTFGDRSFICATQDLWNQLPLSVCLNNSLSSFKNGLKRYYSK